MFVHEHIPASFCRQTVPTPASSRGREATLPGGSRLRSITPHMHRAIDRILIDRDSIADRVEQLGERLVHDLAPVADAGNLVVMPVMTGSIFFTADLVRHLPLAFRILPITLSSYPGTSTSSLGHVEQVTAMPPDLEGRTVLVIEDILDSGRTLKYLNDALLAAGAGDIRACVLLRKDTTRACEVDCGYVGFDIPDDFVVGYGLDYDGLYRNLPDIAVLRSEAIR